MQPSYLNDATASGLLGFASAAAILDTSFADPAASQEIAA